VAAQWRANGHADNVDSPWLAAHGRGDSVNGIESCDYALEIMMDMADWLPMHMQAE
jgi:hypothetical protein